MNATQMGGVSHIHHNLNDIAAMKDGIRRIQKEEEKLLKLHVRVMQAEDLQ